MLYQSEIVSLQRTTVHDLEFVLTTEQGEANRAYIGQWSRDEHMVAINDPDHLHLTIRDHFNERLGYIIITGLQDVNLTTCIKRIVIQPKGLGYGKLSLQIVIDWIFQHTATHRLWLDVRVDNYRAHHVYESSSFTLEGTLRDCVKAGDAFESLHIMSILRHEYMERG